MRWTPLNKQIKKYTVTSHPAVTNIRLFYNIYFIISWPDTIFKQNFAFCAHASQNILKRDDGGKKGKLLCCRCIFNQIKANLAEIQPKNHQKTLIFLHRAPGVNGLILVDNDLGKFSFQWSTFNCFQCTGLKWHKVSSQQVI